VDWFQLREKDLPDRRVYGLLAELCSRPRRPGTKILVNGRLDLALAAGADGVHLTSTGPPTAAVRRTAPDSFLIVRSCHHIEEVVRAEDEGADAATFGPVYPTPSKAAYGPPAGLDALESACAAVGIPVIALGGVDGANAAEVLKRGAGGLAAIRLFWEMEDPAGGVAALRRLGP
jgi:thiamine-phosphate pyrophosphorylase